MSKSSIYKIKNSSDYAPINTQEYFNLEIIKTKNGYDGLFTKESIIRGSVVGHDGGAVVSSVDDVPCDKRYAVLLDEKLFLAPHDYDKLDSFWLLNHSCGANVARIGGLIFVAKRDIQPGEELTVDYSTLIAGVESWSMDCLCDEKKCRKKITGDDWKNSELATDLWTEWLPFIQKRILKRKQ